MTLIFRSSILSGRKLLLNSHNFLIETYHPSTSSFLFPKSEFNYILAKRSVHAVGGANGTTMVVMFVGLMWWG